MIEKERCSGVRELLPRRTILKLIAGAPLIATFGLTASPLMRYLKPTMKAGNFFQGADLPIPDQSVRFEWRDFPDKWTCLPFLLPVRYLVFNPEDHETREIPAFIMRNEANKIIAFSRICPQCRHRQPLNFLMKTADLPDIPQSKNPVLYCPCACDFSIYDLGDNGRALRGRAGRPLRKIDVVFDGKYYIPSGIDVAGIA